MRKHLLYLTNTQLTATMWQGGRLADGRSFPNDESGYRNLSDYLSTCPNVPVTLLMDMIEEDFHRDTIPHVMGSARSNLIDRRLAQLYRDTPYRHASQQGRDKSIRKDDVMLFTALTNAALIKPWIDTILKQKVPVAGIYSTALLSVALLSKLHHEKKPTLFITHQSAGLRQNFFHDGYLRFSRLVQLPSQEPEEVAQVASQEIAKTRVFLANARLLQRNEALDIVVLDNPATLQGLQNLLTESPGANYSYFNQDQAGSALGLKHIPESSVFDLLFLSMLASHTPRSHYPLLQQNLAYTMWKLRLILYAISAATLVSCLLWSGSNMLDTLDAGSQISQLKQETQKNQKLYQQIIESMPKTVANSHDMKSAVDVHELLTKNNSTPKELLVLISKALSQMPQLRLNELSWEVSDKIEIVDPAAAGTTPAAAPEPVPVAADAIPMATLIGIPAKPSEIVIIKGEVIPFENNFRTALESVNQLSVELMKNSHIHVTVLRQPIDIRPSVSLTGAAGNESDTATANFELKIIWTP